MIQFQNEFERKRREAMYSKDVKVFIASAEKVCGELCGSMYLKKMSNLLYCTVKSSRDRTYG